MFAHELHKLKERYTRALNVRDRAITQASRNRASRIAFQRGRDYYGALRSAREELSSSKHPRYDHDCELCRFLFKRGHYDVYAQCSGVGYIARRSSNPSDYVSALDYDALMSAIDATS